MNYNLKSPCVGCPFRVDAAPGYLGSYEADEVIDHIRKEIPFLCHVQIENGPGYEDDDWRDWAEEHGEHCAGALIMAKKMCKMPRDSEHASAVRSVDASQPILFPPQAFVDYHS